MTSQCYFGTPKHSILTITLSSCQLCEWEWVETCKCAPLIKLANHTNNWLRNDTNNVIVRMLWLGDPKIIYTLFTQKDAAATNTVLTLIFRMLWKAKFSSFQAIRGILNKMVEGNEYLEYSDESLECETKLWRPICRGVAYRNWNGRHRVDGANSSARLPRLQGHLVDTRNWRRIRLSRAGNNHDRHAVAVHRYYRA